MSYFNAAQEGHVVSVLSPVDINGGSTSESFHMANWSHASIIIMGGVSAGASTVTVSENTDASQSGTTAIAFNYAAETTAAGDTLGALTACSSSGFATSTNNGIIYVIEIDAAQLSAGYEWITVHFSNPSASNIAGVVAVLSGGRYASDQSATAIA